MVTNLERLIKAMGKIWFALVLVIFTSTASLSQEYHCYPTNWWVGMKYHTIQLMIHGTDAGKGAGYKVSYPGVILKQVHRPEGKNYVFLDLEISESARPGIASVTFT